MSDRNLPAARPPLMPMAKDGVQFGGAGVTKYRFWLPCMALITSGSSLINRTSSAPTLAPILRPHAWNEVADTRKTSAPRLCWPFRLLKLVLSPCRMCIPMWRWRAPDTCRSSCAPYKRMASRSSGCGRMIQLSSVPIVSNSDRNPVAVAMRSSTAGIRVRFTLMTRTQVPLGTWHVETGRK